MVHNARFVSYLISLIMVLAIWAVVRHQSSTEEDFSSAVPARRRPELQSSYDRIDQLAGKFPPLPKPEPGDWLSKYPEGGQTFDQYVTSRGTPVCDQHAEIHLVALGNFTETQLGILDQTQDFLERFYGMPVRRLDPVLLTDLPPEAQRPRDDGKSRQLLTTYLMNDVLLPRRTDQAAALLGFVADDLWGGDQWNWLYGQASIDERVGVWSLFRNGNPDGNDDEYHLCLLRTLKTAAHETGHLFGIPHCIAYSCCMNGSNHREESDLKPLEFCPECQAKLWWTCRLDPQDRYVRLIEFADGVGLTSQAKFWRELNHALRNE